MSKQIKKSKKLKYNLLYEAKVAGTPTAATTAAPAKQGAAGSGIGDALGKILPLVLGLGGLSMLFGKGLFGIGSGKGGLFGGFWGKLIGGTVLATVIPSLWSKQGLGDRLSSAGSKLVSGDFMGALKAFIGLDSGADKAIEASQKTMNELATNKDTIEAKAKKFTQNAVPFCNVVKWLKADNRYVNSDAHPLQITPTIATILAHTNLDSEKENNDGKDDFIAIIYMNDEQQVQVQMAQPSNLAGSVSQDFAATLKQVFIKDHLQKGLTYLTAIQNSGLDCAQWYDNFEKFVDALLSVRQNDIGTTCVLKLFNDGFTSLCEGHGLKTIELPDVIEETIKAKLAKLHLILEDSEDSFSDLMNNPELAELKEDPTLNKFDEDIKLLDEQINDEFTKLLQKLLLNQDENGKPIYEMPDGCIIYGLLGKEHYYYCRDRQNGYLTTDVEKSVMFPGSDIEKIKNESPIEVSTGEHMSIDESLPILWKEYTKEGDEENKIKDAFNNYKEEHQDIQDEKALFKQFVTEQGDSILPFKKEKRDIAGNSLKETLQNFLIAVKLPQLMKIKKPGIQVNVYETNTKALEEIKKICKEKLNIEL